MSETKTWISVACGHPKLTEAELTELEAQTLEYTTHWQREMPKLFGHILAGNGYVRGRLLHILNEESTEGPS